jgi:hypothetical protein
VCLNQKCRNNPLCCCVCFTNNHKVKWIKCSTIK